MVLLDDVVVGLGAAVATASLVVLGTFLVRYRSLVKEASNSSTMAKNIYDAMNSRFAVQDGRIIDLMAKFDVYSVKRKPVLSPGPVVTGQTSRESVVSPQSSQTKSQVPAEISQPTQSVRATKDTSATILRSLLEGPRTSNQIREVIQLTGHVTREHNARLLKALFEKGLVVRNDQNKPFVYEITEAGRAYVAQVST